MCHVTLVSLFLSHTPLRRLVDLVVLYDWLDVLQENINVSRILSYEGIHMFIYNSYGIVRTQRMTCHVDVFQYTSYAHCRGNKSILQGRFLCKMRKYMLQPISARVCIIRLWI